MIIIPIAGEARHGKDTFAKLIKERCDEIENCSCIILHYGDFVKFLAAQYFGWNGKKDKLGRTILQKTGTDHGRVHNPDIWTNMIIDTIKGFQHLWDIVVIPDWRFPNEFWKLVDEFEGDKIIPLKICRINEDGSDYDNGMTEEQKNHPSETALNDFKHFFQIYTFETGDILGMKEEIELLGFQNFNYKKKVGILDD